jgi:hypothetical protein
MRQDKKLALVVLVVTRSLSSGCHRALAPQLHYSLPPAVFLPIESAGIRDASSDFVTTFCTVLREFEAEAEYGCDHFLVGAHLEAGLPVILLKNFAWAKYRIVTVSGFLSGCAKGPQFEMFGDTDDHLKMHHIVLERVSLKGLGSVEDGANQVVNYLRATTQQNDKRKILFVGYSKGAADLLSAMVQLLAKLPH